MDPGGTCLARLEPSWALTCSLWAVPAPRGRPPATCRPKELQFPRLPWGAQPHPACTFQPIGPEIFGELLRWVSHAHMDTRITYELRLRHVYDAFAHTCTPTHINEECLHVTHAHTIHMHSCTHGCVQQSSSTRAHMHPSARCHSLPHTRIAQTHDMQPLFVCTNICTLTSHTSNKDLQARSGA